MALLKTENIMAVSPTQSAAAKFGDLQLQNTFHGTFSLLYGNAIQLVVNQTERTGQTNRAVGSRHTHRHSALMEYGSVSLEAADLLHSRNRLFHEVYLDSTV